MNLPKIVCPNNRDLLSGFSGYRVAVRVNKIAHAATAAANVQNSGNSLICVIVDSALPLEGIEFCEEQKTIPLAVMAPFMGKFRNMANRLEMLRDFDLRVYLPCGAAENITALKILSSVGISCCAVMGYGRTDWEALTDLMTYALLERVPHASIEPFEYIASNYDPIACLGWGRVCFDDPAHFLHLDAKGRAALSYSELRKKKFIAQSIAEVGDPAQFPAVRERLQEWRGLFAENHICASCNGWKICMGRFSERASKDSGCSAFFREMIEVTRQYRAKNVKAEERRIWQP
jgi:hypothetical protein